MQGRLKLRKHAHERCFQRGISRGEVRRVLKTGETIQEYPDDTPLPSYLVLGWVETEAGERPLHVVAADDEKEDVTYAITVYEPDPDLWTDDFREKQSD
jgi:hypothetical protein